MELRVTASSAAVLVILIMKGPKPYATFMLNAGEAY